MRHYSAEEVILHQPLFLDIFTFDSLHRLAICLGINVMLRKSIPHWCTEKLESVGVDPVRLSMYIVEVKAFHHRSDRMGEMLQMSNFTFSRLPSSLTFGPFIPSS